MLAEAYELARKGDYLGAGQVCLREFRRTLHPILAIEGSDFLRLAGRLDESLQLAIAGEKQVRAFASQLTFARSLSLRDQGEQASALGALEEAVRAGYSNTERFDMEWSARLPAESLLRLRSLISANAESSAGETPE